MISRASSRVRGRGTVTPPHVAYPLRDTPKISWLGPERLRFIITKSGKPAAVVIGATDFDDMLEELDPEFQKSLKVAEKEHRAGKSLTLKDYLRQRLARRAG